MVIDDENNNFSDHVDDVGGITKFFGVGVVCLFDVDGFKNNDDDDDSFCFDHSFSFDFDFIDIEKFVDNNDDDDDRFEDLSVQEV